MARKDPAKLKKIEVGLPFGLGKAEWEADPTERKAAWCLYVELVTRVAVQELEEDQGSLREALASLYSLFGSTREILREAGPDVGIGRASIGGLAINVLNQGLRPFLTRWHIRLREWEERLAPGGSAFDHERAWPEAAAFRKEMLRLRGELEVYSTALARFAGAE